MLITIDYNTIKQCFRTNAFHSENNLITLVYHAKSAVYCEYNMLYYAYNKCILYFLFFKIIHNQNETRWFIQIVSKLFHRKQNRTGDHYANVCTLWWIGKYNVCLVLVCWSKNHVLHAIQHVECQLGSACYAVVFPSTSFLRQYCYS